MSRSYVQPEEETAKGKGLYYCYDLQAWVQDGVVLVCPHPAPMSGCGGCVNGGASHGSCSSCH